MYNTYRPSVLKAAYSQRRNVWKRNAVKNHMQPIVDQVKPIVYETLGEVYKPLLEKTYIN